MGKRFAMCISGLLSGAIPQVAWAEGAGGSYRGIATLYHFFWSRCISLPNMFRRNEP